MLKRFYLFALIPLTLVGRAMAQTTIGTQNWDGVTAPAKPTGWNYDAGFATQTTYYISSPNALQFTGSTTASSATFGTPDNSGGDGTVSTKGKITATNDGLRVFMRSDTNAYNLFTSHGYNASIKNGTGLRIFNLTSQVGTTVGAAAFTNGATYILSLTCLGNLISASVQRGSDSFYLNSSGTFVSGATVAISATDTSSGAWDFSGYAGVGASLNAAGDSAYFDDFSFTSPALAAGAPVITTVTSTGMTITSANTGGTAPYSIQFQRAPDVSGSPGTFVSVGTAGPSNTFTDSSLAASTAYWYRYLVTDSAGTPATATSASVSQTTAATSPLAIGSLTATVVSTGVALSLSSALSGGTGASYLYKIYRDTQPAVAVTGTTLATVASLPYTDTTAAAGTTYYYKVIGTDSGANLAYSTPAGLGSVSTTSALAATATTPSGQFILVFLGDSVTYGANLTNAGTVLSPTYPYYCLTYFSAMAGVRSVVATNQGHNGYTTNSWLPSVNTSSCFTNLETAVSTLKTAYPSAQIVFIDRLGTNDSASAGTNNNPTGPASATTVAANDVTLGSRLLTDYPGSKIFLDHPTWYSPNTQNGATYAEAGLALMVSYGGYIDGAVTTLNASFPGRAYIGETTAYADFATNYLAFDQAESGVNGTFYLHPNSLGGTAELGRLEATRLYNALFVPATATRVRRIN